MWSLFLQKQALDVPRVLLRVCCDTVPDVLFLQDVANVEETKSAYPAAVDFITKHEVKSQSIILQTQVHDPLFPSPKITLGTVHDPAHATQLLVFDAFALVNTLWFGKQAAAAFTSFIEKGLGKGIRRLVVAGVFGAFFLPNSRFRFRTDDFGPRLVDLPARTQYETIPITKNLTLVGFPEAPPLREGLPVFDGYPRPEWFLTPRCQSLPPDKVRAKGLKRVAANQPVDADEYICFNGGEKLSHRWLRVGHVRLNRNLFKTDSEFEDLDSLPPAARMTKLSKRLQEFASHPGGTFLK
jgi:hypothetical protein